MNKQLTPQEKEQLEIERSLKSFHNIEKVARENPHISASAVMRRETLRKIRKRVNMFIQKNYSKTIGNFLGGETFKVKFKPNSPAEQLSIWANK